MYLMPLNRIHLITRVRDYTLAVFCSQTNDSDDWEFQIISTCGEILGDNKIYSTQIAAENAGRNLLVQID